MVVYFKDWAAIEAYEDPRFDITGLTPAEQELKEAVATGQFCVLDKTYPADIADGLPPKPDNWSNPNPTRHIRADVLRFVLLQKVAHGKMTEAGTCLYGAQITGTLDLSDATIPTYCGLIACRFESAIAAERSQFHSNAAFWHSTLPALSAAGAAITGQLSCVGARFEAQSGKTLDLQGAQIGDSLFLRNVTAASTIDISGATITGQLDCTSALFEAQSGIALNLQRAQIGESLFLRDVTAASTIDIKGATIKGQLSCLGARFETQSGRALNLQGAQIGDGLYFRKVLTVKGRIVLTAAQTSLLADDAESWSLVDDLILDGFRYDRIGGDTKPTFSERMDWLEKGSVFESEFRPQPYTQLAETYKRAGNDRQARDVRVALAKKLAEEDWYDTHEKWLARELLFEAPYPLGQWIGRLLHKCLRLSVTTSKSFWDWLFRNVVGYGYKPFNSLWFLFGLIVAAWILAYSAWHEGQFAPNSAPILVSKAWTDLEADPKAATKWSTKGNAGQDWETFNSFAYAADIVIPIVEIGQTSAWAPSPARGPWGATLWWARWVFTAAGWIISALGAAAITGVIRRE